ncbi:MAG: hypothetical protein MJ174_10800 [Treponema sp.]|nr:hypothetical protein [Treponema sp.]
MINELIHEFLNKINTIKDDIYNEFSLQHELGIFLREKLTDYKVQFERNVSFFDGFENKDFIKKEMDIVIYKTDLSEKYAIELKFPKNGQYPETMFSFLKDINFMEQVKNNLLFTNTFVLTLVTDKNFYEGSYPSVIYEYFRGGKKNKIINGEIQKPTGKKDEMINIAGNYCIEWKKTQTDFVYYMLSI